MNRPVLSLRIPRAPRILIEPEIFGSGWDVRVLPPPKGIGHDRELPTIEAARAYADQLAKAMGWPVVDHSACDDAAA